MAEEAQPAPVQDQPSTPIEADGQGAPSQDGTPEFFGENFDPAQLDDPRLQQAYQQMRADYTRKTQEVAEQRRSHEQQLNYFERLTGGDPEAFQQLAQQYGYVLPEDENPDEGFDGFDQEPDEFRDPRVDQMLAEQQTQAEIAQQAQVIDQAIRQVAPDLSEQESLLVFAQVAGTPWKNGFPDPAPALDTLKAIKDQAIQSYVESKRAPSAPGSGVAASQQYDRKDPDARARRMAAILEASG